MFECEICKRADFKSELGLHSHKKRIHGVIDEALKKRALETFKKIIKDSRTKTKKLSFADPNVKAINPILILQKKPKVIFEVPLCQLEGYELGREVQIFSKPIYQKKFRKLPAVYFYSEADNKEMEIIRVKRSNKDIDLEIQIPNHRSIIFKRKYYTEKGLYKKN